MMEGGSSKTKRAAAYGRGKGKDMSKVQCFDCREYGHIAANCANKVCNYCKKQGHFIKECPTRPPPRKSSTSSPTIPDSPIPEMVQQIMSECPFFFQGLGVKEDTREGA
ncbi:uncharacterized protein LOC133880701 isoform X2 [Alnus glutinosa]|uniref:uncharacterized protein LOC133880701 isoform X2 n=1 Tax=Alnus glutinosa TaxID=3517 RepID=UPI002D77E92B|nr:uncharacterized protein LOC133880701 isoform X2 [Alnus glutinosa]